MDVQGVIDHITNWLKEYSHSSGTKGFVVGISGGIDSAVTSSLCARTGLPTLCLEMPIHQNQQQVNRGKEHIQWLKEKYPAVEFQETDLSPTFDTLVDSLPNNTGPNHLMALVNTRARLRMTILYYFAGLKQFLVAGTGNKVEDFGVGFYTKYGDGGVDLSPIADLTKTEVYLLARHLNIISSIIKAPPTDGLWGDERTDEDQLGATYPELEWAMEFTGSEDNLPPRQQEVLKIYRKLNRINQHKMVPIPVCTIPPSLRQSNTI